MSSTGRKSESHDPLYHKINPSLVANEKVQPEGQNNLRDKMSERSLHKAVCDYLRYRYKTTMFNSDLSGATKLTMGQAVAMKSLRSQRGFPDLQIMEARNGFHGLFIELKQEGIKLYNKLGLPATPHIGEQLYCLVDLRIRGYKAEFACGFDEAKNLIDDYLNE